MTTDPGEHDLWKLAELAEPDSDRSQDHGNLIADVRSPHTDEELLRARQREELARLDARDDAERPYLSTLPGAYAGEVTVFEWLDYLIDAAGFKATGRALSYYVEIGWLTEDVEENLRAYMRGFSDVASFDPDGPGPRNLGLDDHVLSLVYIARLASMV